MKILAGFLLSLCFVFGGVGRTGSQLPIGPQGDIIVYNIEQGKVLIRNGQSSVLTRPGSLVQVEVSDFSRYEARQLSTDWCWAACLQMLFNHRDVSITQEEVVSQMKGRVVYDTASSADLNKYLNQAYRLKDGRNWKANTLYIPNKIDPNVMLRMLGSTERPLLVSMKLDDDEDTQHLVAVFRTSFRAGGEVESITIYDPYDGKEKTLSWKDAVEKVTGSFAAMVVGSEKKDPRVF